MANTLITIARQLGSGGSRIGLEISKKLGFKYFDREIVRQAAAMLKDGEDIFTAREEKLSGFFENLIRPFILGSPEAAYMPPPLHPVYDRDIFDTESGIIRQIAAKYNAVIVGRGGGHVLKGHPGLVNVFVHAPLEFRVKRIMELYKISDEKEAGELAAKSDHDRAKYIKMMTGQDWTDLRNYHLCLDSERAGFEAAQEIVCRIVNEVRK
ncbi:MAG: cytidylate kinase-like family protein [Actinomycetota bacterium]|nr:cytidylate kinase-like family protein [Actinomycetota bacterium]